MTTPDLLPVYLTREDWLRVMGALRAQSRDYYNKMTELGERGTYYDLLWHERHVYESMAHDIELKLSP